MLYYPQLTSGSICQFPIGWRAAVRCVSNELAGGDTIRMSDPGAGKIRWQLQYSSLTDGEQTAIERLFEAAEGQLETFTFLDPTDNLLMWSEDWSKPVWARDSLLQVSLGQLDPLGGNGAIAVTNTAQTTQRVVQILSSASWFQYCYSLYLRSDAPAIVQLLQTTNGNEVRTAAAVSPAWTRYVRSGSLTGTQQDGISFGVELPAGVRITAFGAQVEAQIAAGSYKKTTDHAGVYAKTRFESDSFPMTKDAPNQNSCTVNLVSSLA